MSNLHRSERPNHRLHRSERPYQRQRRKVWDACETMSLRHIREVIGKLPIWDRRYWAWYAASMYRAYQEGEKGAAP